MDLDQLGLPPGTKIGHFKIVRMVGVGGMGAVYEAEHIDLRKRVAIKTLKPEYAKNSEIKERFLREGIAASKIRHPHAVDVFDVGRHGNIAYLVMEYLDGESLADVITRERRLSVGRTLDVMIPVMAAVNAAHHEDIVHRDLKPENIFLATTRDGVVVPKVVDFGISKLNIQGARPRLTATDNVFGTPEYMSPEQIENPRDVDARADQFALGVILFECVTGALPFESDSMYGLMKEVVEGRARSLRTMNVLVPMEFIGAVDRALQRRPDDRFPSVAHLARELLPLAPRRTRTAWMPVFEPSAGAHPSELPTPLVPPAMIDAVLADVPDATPGPLPVVRVQHPSTVDHRARSKRSFIASVLVASAAGMLVAHWRSLSVRPAPLPSMPPAMALPQADGTHFLPPEHRAAAGVTVPDLRFESAHGPTVLPTSDDAPPIARASLRPSSTPRRRAAHSARPPRRSQRPR